MTHRPLFLKIFTPWLAAVFNPLAVLLHLSSQKTLPPSNPYTSEPTLSPPSPRLPANPIHLRQLHPRYLVLPLPLASTTILSTTIYTAKQQDEDSRLNCGLTSQTSSNVCFSPSRTIQA